MSYHRKFILLVFISVFSLLMTSCQDNTKNRPDLNINTPDTVYDDLEDSKSEWTLDTSGQFSYLRMQPRGNTRPLFNPNLLCPGNMFLYETIIDSIHDIRKYGYMDIDFHVLCEPISTSPNIFMFGLTRIQTEEGSYIINTNFETLEEYYPGYVLYDNSLVAVDWTDEPIDEPYIVSGIDPENYLVPYKVTPGLGTTFDVPVVGYKTIENAYYNTTSPEDKFEIPAMFEEAGLFIDGIAAVKINGKWGFIDQTGEFVIECEHYYAKSLTHGIVAILSEIWPETGKVQATRRWALFDTAGNQLTDFLYYGVSKFIDDLALMYFSPLDANPKTAFVNTDGKQITPALYSTLSHNYYSEGYVLLSNSGYYFYDTEGNQAFSRRFSGGTGSFSEGLAAFRESGSMLYGYIDTKGNVSIKKKYRIAEDFSKGYAYVSMGNDTGGYLIDKAESEYLKGLNLMGITRFNEDGYALAYSIELNEYTIPDPDNPSGFIKEERQDTIYYMIHIETP